MDRLPLTRTACLTDYPDCISVGQWQQQLAIDAYQRWGGDPTEPPALCLNWGAASFRAPGPDPVYIGYHDALPEQGPYSSLFALSVLDRVQEPIRFLHQQIGRLLPGSLVVCTFAIWDALGDDSALGCEMRHRIYDWHSWQRLVRRLTQLGLQPFGGVDFRYHGDTLGDHTLASMTLMKERS
jgi:hypothetical protein